MRQTTVAVPGWLLYGGATLVASIFAAGTMALILIGRMVPTELWVIDTAISVAYFGAGPFQLVSSNHAAAMAHQLDTTNHAIETLRVIAGAKTGATTQEMTTDGGQAA